MGDFNYCCSHVLQADMPIGARFNAFIRCCSAIARLGAARPGGLNMQSVYDRLGAELGFSRSDKPSGDQMVVAVSILIATRFRLLHERAEYARRRKKAKQSGHSGKASILFEGFDPLNLLKASTQPRDYTK